MVAHVSTHQNSGFTLVEMAMVITIIGLIIGGVLVGRDMISAAESRRFISQMSSIAAAVATFRDKYNCVPGDCTTATNFGLTGGNGDGNGTIGACSGPGGGGRLSDPSTTICYNRSYGGMSSIMVRSYREPNYFFTHLTSAGLIPGQISAIPLVDTNLSASMDQYFMKSALGKGYLHVLSWNNVTYIRTGIVGTDASGNPWQQQGGLSAQQALYLTQKMGETNIDDFVGSACGTGSVCAEPPPNVLFRGPVVPIGAEIPTGPAGGYFYLNPRYIGGSPGHPGACITGNPGSYRFNLGVEGNCNVLWRVDGM